MRTHGKIFRKKPLKTAVEMSAVSVGVRNRESQTIYEVFQNRLKPRYSRVTVFSGFIKPHRWSDFRGFRNRLKPWYPLIAVLSGFRKPNTRCHFRGFIGTFITAVSLNRDFAKNRQSQNT